MTTSRLESLTWLLVYGGMILLGLGLSLKRDDASLGWAIVIVGGLATAAGIVLIVVRSRIDRRP